MVHERSWLDQFGWGGGVHWRAQDAVLTGGGVTGFLSAAAASINGWTGADWWVGPAFAFVHMGCSLLAMLIAQEDLRYGSNAPLIELLAYVTADNSADVPGPDENPFNIKPNLHITVLGKLPRTFCCYHCRAHHSHVLRFRKRTRESQ